LLPSRQSSSCAGAERPLNGRSRHDVCAPETNSRSSCIMSVLCGGLKLFVGSAAATFLLLLLCAASTSLCSGSAGAAYVVRVLHPNARPIAAGDEITFLDRGDEPEHDYGDDFAAARCPVDVVAFIERGAAPAHIVQQPVLISLQLVQAGITIPMFPAYMSPNLKHSIAAGSLFAARADSAGALQCSASGAQVAVAHHARVALLVQHVGGDRVLAQSEPFLLRVLCGSGGLFSRACPAGAAPPVPAASCTLHHASPWSPPFTSVGEQTPSFHSPVAQNPPLVCSASGSFLHTPRFAGSIGLPASAVARVVRVEQQFTQRAAQRRTV
jgi:hypothetical protein